LIRIVGLDVSIGTVQVLRGVSLEVESGSMAGLIGRNGAGKTTLMRSIMGLTRIDVGSITFDGVELRTLSAHQRARHGIGYMPEDRRLVPELTVEENVLLPQWATGNADGGKRLQHVYTLIPEIAPLASRKAMQLSGGQQKLVALGRALMCGTRLLLLDEPFEGVAPALSQRLVQVVGALKNEGMSILLSESDFQHSERLVDRVFSIDRGVVSASERC
jgi:branched-chain amino acid transport system ATP-binding protein